MTGGPHPLLMILVTEERFADLRAEADRDRSGDSLRRRVPQFLGLGLLVAALALLLLAHTVTA